MSVLPRISGRQAVAALAKLGYQKDRQKGSHIMPIGSPRPICWHKTNGAARRCALGHRGAAREGFRHVAPWRCVLPEGRLPAAGGVAILRDTESDGKENYRREAVKVTQPAGSRPSQSDDQT